MFKPVDLIEHIGQLKNDLDGLYVQAAVLQSFGDAALEAIFRGNKIPTCGNGGSATEATHFAKELTGLFTGGEGGRAGASPTTKIQMASADGSSMRIQECHPFLMHVLCEMVETGYLSHYPPGCSVSSFKLT